MIGFINLYKPCGMSSAMAVTAVKKALNYGYCGHLGTLDPLAEGVLPISLGKASRLFDYLNENKTKKYTAEFIFGYATDTLDITGKIIDSGGRLPSEKEIRAVLPKLTGEYEQIPPAFSAKKVAGYKAYELARKGIMPELKAKKITVYSFEMISYSDEKGSFEISCSSGTYIRCLARDLAAKLGTYAVMSGLIRTQSGGFAISDAVKIDEISADSVISIEAAVRLPRYTVPTEHAKKFLSGTPFPAEFEADKLVYYNGELYALASCANGLLKIKAYLKE